MCKGGYTTHQLSCSTPLLKLGPLPYHPESVLVRCTGVWLNLSPHTTHDTPPRVPRGARMVRTRGARKLTAARAAVLQDANLLAEVLSFLPLPGTILLTREVARLWRDTAKRPLLRVALHALALKRAKLMSDAYVDFRTSGTSARQGRRPDMVADLHPAVKWLVDSFENSICSAVFDQAGGYRKFVVDALAWFLDQGLDRLLIVAQPSALRNWARVLQAAGVSCTLQVTTDYRDEELHARLPVVLLCTPSQLEVELDSVQWEGRNSHGGIFGSRYWAFAVFDAAPMVHLHETQQVALSSRLHATQCLLEQPPLVYVLLSASPPPTQLHMLAPLLDLCRSSFQRPLYLDYGDGTCDCDMEAGPGADVELYSRVLEVVDRFCMGDAETRQWALEDYLPSEVAYLLRPCLLTT